MIDVGTNEKEETPILVETNGRSGQYITLSHQLAKRKRNGEVGYYKSGGIQKKGLSISLSRKLPGCNTRHTDIRGMIYLY